MFDLNTFNESQTSLRHLNETLQIANKFFQLRRTLSRLQYYIENAECNMFDILFFSANQIFDFMFAIREYEENEKYFVGLVLHLFYSYQNTFLGSIFRPR